MHNELVQGGQKETSSIYELLAVEPIEMKF